MRDASFSRHGVTIVPPTTLDVDPGARLAALCATPDHAMNLALLAAGLVKTTSGSLLIGAYDPRVQPVHCKRLVGYVSHDPLTLAPHELDRYIEYRAALWGIDPMRARAHAKLILERLDGLHEAFAYAIAGALLAAPSVLVLDRPQLAYARQIIAAAGPIAIFSTHVDPRAADAYRTPQLVESFA